MQINEDENRDIMCDVSMHMDTYNSEEVSIQADLFLDSEKPFVTEADICNHSGGFKSNTSIEAKYMEIYGDVEIEGDLKTSEGFSGEEDVTVYGNLNVSGGTCLVGGNLLANSITVNKTQDDDDGLVVDGKIISQGEIRVFGDLRCGGDVTANEIDVTGNLTIVGNTTATKITVGGISEFGGEVNGILESVNTQKLPEEKVVRLTRNIMQYRTGQK